MPVGTAPFLHNDAIFCPHACLVIIISDADLYNNTGEVEMCSRNGCANVVYVVSAATFSVSAVRPFGCLEQLRNELVMMMMIVVAMFYSPERVCETHANWMV